MYYITSTKLWNKLNKLVMSNFWATLFFSVMHISIYMYNRLMIHNIHIPDLR